MVWYLEEYWDGSQIPETLLHALACSLPTLLLIYVQSVLRIQVKILRLTKLAGGIILIYYSTTKFMFIYIINVDKKLLLNPDSCFVTFCCVKYDPIYK